LRVAFKSLLALTRQNTMRAGNLDMIYPRAWVYAALEAVESAAALNATPGDVVLVGFNVFSAAAAGTKEDIAEGERIDATRWSRTTRRSASLKAMRQRAEKPAVHTEKSDFMAPESVLSGSANLSTDEAAALQRAEEVVPALEHVTGTFLRGAVQAAASEGWQEEHAERIAAAGVQRFVQAAFDGVDPQAAIPDAFRAGRNSLLGHFVEDNADGDAGLQAGFRRAMTVLQRNNLRMGETAASVPEVWIDGATRAAGVVASAGGTTVDQVNAGLSRLRNLSLDASLDQALGYS